MYNRVHVSHSSLRRTAADLPAHCAFSPKPAIVYSCICYYYYYYYY